MQNVASSEAEALSVEDAARRAGVGRTFMYQALSPDEGKRDGLPYLPSIKVGRRRLVRVSTLRNWLAKLENTPPQVAA